ncbi:hypothetical protein [Lentzea sp. NPDC003310]|uniref:PD-(D/E)XK nuclease domain-containing protein n=1 Tax=Lentzea sp. NPDC003310 TaxID=3154447 RepID=UPI0033BAA2E8
MVLVTAYGDPRGQSDPTGQLLAGQLAALEAVILTSNRPGNLDGLLAHHILGDRHVAFHWDVNPMTLEWLAENEHRLEHGPGVAILGYGLTAFPSTTSPAARQHLVEGLRILQRRDPFRADDGVTFVNDPGQIVGVALAVNLVRDELPRAREWLAAVLQDARLQPPGLLVVFQEHARYLLGLESHLGADHRAVDDLSVLAGLQWLAMSSERPVVETADEMRALQSRLLTELVLGKAGQVSVPRAALLLEVASQLVTASVDELVLGQSHVALILSRFADAMRRWRYDGDDVERPTRWKVTNEYHVQDILWIMLRPVFNDLVDEETLRKVGHSTYRADFGIPSLGLLIEVKYARKAGDFKIFEKEILQDHGAYFMDNGPYRKMLVFIYDESASVQEHGTTRNALVPLENITDVIIACRPSHVPIEERPAAQRRAPRRR